MSQFGIGGVVSTSNSSTSVLTAGASFTGTGEVVTPYSTITVFVDTDKDGTLSMEFSTDNTNWDRAKSIVIDQELGSGSVHTLEVVSKYFRVVVTNDDPSATQGHLRLQTIYHNTRSGFLSVTPDQVISKVSDAQVVRVANDTYIDLSRGLYGDKQTVHKFGSNTAVGTTEEDIWVQGGTYPWLEAGTALEVKSGSTDDDDTTGSGAHSITVEGLDTDFNPLSVTYNLNGTTFVIDAGFPEETGWLRIYRAYVTDVGTYTGTNVGDITIRESDGSGTGTVLAKIAAGTGQTQMSHYTVPAGYTAYLRHLHAQVDASKPADVRLFRRTRANDVTTPFQGARLIHQWLGLDEKAELDFYSMPSFPEKTDIWATAIGSQSGARVDVVYDLILVKGDSPTNPQ